MTAKQFKRLKIGDKVRVSRRVKVGESYDHLTCFYHMKHSRTMTVETPLDNSGVILNVVGATNYYYTAPMLVLVSKKGVKK